MNQISAFLIDIHQRSIYPARISYSERGIQIIEPCDASLCKTYVLPGFVDAHIHIESSLMVPSQFARMAVAHGTVATVSDPHEIANVLGVKGVEYMLDDASNVPFHFFFGAPSCVPASVFETNGATLGPAEVEYLLSKDSIWYLAEVMNFPGVIAVDPDLMQKIAIAKRLNKPVDGHAPALSGEGLKKYIAAGITTDHECFKLEEALEKLENGMKIQIREGSAACNFEALHSLISSHRASVMLCSDDKHPDSLLDGHLNSIVKRALLKGHNLFDCLIAASKNTIEHYSLPVGMLRTGDSADFIEIDSPENFLVLQTVIKGKTVYNRGDVLFDSPRTGSINEFLRYQIKPEDIKVSFSGEQNIPVIQAIDGQLITTKGLVSPKVINNEIVSDVSRDILKIVVINRYHQAKPAVSFIQNFGLKKGAMASTVAHDSHNLIAVGTNDEDLLRVIELVQNSKGGLAATAHGIDELLPLDVAGLMSTLSADDVTDRYIRLDHFVKHELGSGLRAPFMTLSFMALLVIPSIKLSDKGLFDGDSFRFM